MSINKDFWDKLEIGGKPLIALIAAIAVFLWNTERTSAEREARMTELAISILTEDPSNEAGSSSQPIREWAISVLDAPGTNHPLTEEAKEQLLQERIYERPTSIGEIYGMNMSPLSDIPPEEQVCRLPENYDLEN